jgi:hypothetical protein
MAKVFLFGRGHLPARMTWQSVVGRDAEGRVVIAVIPSLSLKIPPSQPEMPRIAMIIQFKCTRVIGEVSLGTTGSGKKNQVLK